MTATRVRISEPHRRLRLAGARAAVGVRTALPRRPSRRQRATVCDAARLLTAAGVRVHVFSSTTPWPRSGGQLVVSGSVGRVDQLAVLTAVPRHVHGWAELAGRALGLRLAPGATGSSDVLLPVTVRYRDERTGSWLAGAAVPRDLPAALAHPGLVVEVHLLPPLHPAGG